MSSVIQHVGMNASAPFVKDITHANYRKVKQYIYISSLPDVDLDFLH